MNKKLLFVIVIAATLIIIGCTKTPENVLDMNLKDHKDIALHIHPILEIYILGEKQDIPTDFGINGEMMRVIHTHDTSGKLHIESPVPHQFYLEDVFMIWGKPFNSNCIFEYCMDKNHTLNVYVNGFEDQRFGAIPLRDQDVIKIEYKEK